MNLEYLKFKYINLDDPFFDSLKEDYKEFPAWFAKKAEDKAYVFRGESNGVDGFLYLKNEGDEVSDVEPPLPAADRIKVGTFKINPHGTRLGERFLKKIFDHAIDAGVDEIYVTVFDKHAKLVELFERYGFVQRASKTTLNGKELVLVRALSDHGDDILSRYPVINAAGANTYLLSLHPQWHTRLLPDSILRNEDGRIVEDISHTNSIHKVYLTNMRGVENLRRGDILAIYRTSDGQGSARFRSVATSLCVVEEYRDIGSFRSREEFLIYCRPYSVFSDEELSRIWQCRNYPKVIRFTYNIALDRRPNRGRLIDEVGLSEDAYWGFMRLTPGQLKHIAALGEVHESLVVD